MLRLMPFALTLLLWAAGVLIAPCALAEQLDAPVPAPSVSVDGLKSFGTSGKAVYPFTEGDKTEAVLFEHEGKGCLTHMWFGGNWAMGLHIVYCGLYIVW